MRTIRTALAVASAMAAISTAAAREKVSPLPQHMPLRKEVCFGRTYDAAHLKRHPEQRVTAFHLFRDFTPDANTEAPAVTAEELKEWDGKYGSIAVTAFVRFRDRKGLYWNGLSCNPTKDGGVNCGVDCDGGGFRIRASGGSLLVENLGFVVVGGCGASDDEMEMSDFVDPGEDDKLFRLDPKPAVQCRALDEQSRPAWAELGQPVRARLHTTDEVCFARRYDAAHLAKHPDQTVTRIAMLKPAGAASTPGDDYAYELTFRAQLKDGRIVEKKTVCGAEQYAFRCANNAGDFYLSRAGGEHVMLRDRRGYLSSFFNAKLGEDDRMFRLQKSPDGECRF